MNEETKIKVTIPMFEDRELEKFDTYINEIAREFTNLHFKEKDKILTQRLVQKLQEENERLLSIIKEVREYIEEHKRNVYDTFGETIVFGDIYGIKEILQILNKEYKK